MNFFYVTALLIASALASPAVGGVSQGQGLAERGDYEWCDVSIIHLIQLLNYILM